MSFVDLATLTMHRRNEMETRINIFMAKCDQATNNIKNLKLRAQGFVQQLNCDPSELKERFLNCMKNLDEFNYLITDLNLAVSKLEETSSTELTPVHDTTCSSTGIPPNTYNLIDALSEPTPSTSTACSNYCQPEKPKRAKIPKEDQLLIAFSSSSCSAESVKQKNFNVEKIEKEVQCALANDISQLTVKECETPSSSVNYDEYKIYDLPAQSVLQVDHIYPATVMHIDGDSFWVITSEVDEVYSLMTDMTNHYSKNTTKLSIPEITTLAYCACYDVEDKCYYRGFFIRTIEDKIAEVFFVDTGEVRHVPIDGIQPLAPQFCEKPPYARCCHLAGVDYLSGTSKDLKEQQEKFMRQYNIRQCQIEVDDNASESLGVYVILPTKEVLNKLLIKHALGISDKETSHPTANTVQGPPEFLEDSLDITEGPEYEDPVEAVAGYHSRDEADICQHYKGGPEKTCFKGAHCRKRHVMMHPDGWTLDQVSVAAKYRSLPLPAPGLWVRVHITYVCHFDSLFVQFSEQLEKRDKIPSFGVVLPPTTLNGLVRDMNSPATRIAYKPLTAMPAVGELVAALYPLDNQWYRAKVQSFTRSDQNVEVMYLDYGNVVWVKEDAIRALEPRHLQLPAQAVRCVLAGVYSKSEDCQQWVRAKQALVDLVQDRTLDAQIVGRDYEELTIELFDEQGYNIAEQLAAKDLIKLQEYEVVSDTNVPVKVVVP